MMIAMIASEMEPFVKTGGLGDVLGALPYALAREGERVDVYLPRYSWIPSESVPSRRTNGVKINFVEHNGYFARSGIYGDGTRDYPDNSERFSFLCRQALLKMKESGVRPDIVHGHDWQGALSVVYLKALFREDAFFAKTRSVFTVHNLSYQGIFPASHYSTLGLSPDLFDMEGLEFYGKVNLLKGGLLFGDRLTTVSPTYAGEIQTKQWGEGLDGVLRRRSGDLVGILNGIDVDLWNPATDRAIASCYDADHLKEKEKNKKALQKEMGLPFSGQTFLVGMVTRLASQKGLDLLLKTIPQLGTLPIQFVVLGAGDRPIQQSLESAAQKFPWFKIRTAFDLQLARRIYAGADAFLMPSYYEPCGLSQMIALRYGTIPIVRATGGLVDTVTDYDFSTNRGNGFSFVPYEAEALADAVQRAFSLYADVSKWKALQRVVMGIDFSWGRPAAQYRDLYWQLLAPKERRENK